MSGPDPTTELYTRPRCNEPRCSSLDALTLARDYCTLPTPHSPPLLTDSPTSSTQRQRQLGQLPQIDRLDDPSRPERKRDLAPQPRRRIRRVQHLLHHTPRLA